MDKITVGVSKCLLGERVRYDGQHKHDRYITGTLGQFFEWVPICPEVECGLPIPREAMRLVGDDKDQPPKLMTRKTKKDITPMMVEWAEKRLDQLVNENICGYIFKSRSPSSGMTGVKIYGTDGMPKWTGPGIFAGMLQERMPNLPVIDEGRLHDPGLRGNFIEHVFVYHRWQELTAKGVTAKALQKFHADHKYLLMSRSPKSLTALGRLAAMPFGKDGSKIVNEYFELLTATMRLQATTKKHVNVLTHLAGYFKKELTSEEKQELLEVIDDFKNGLLPLLVPITLIRHYVRKYHKDYLDQQWYINPGTLELMSSNHP